MYLVFPCTVGSYHSLSNATQDGIKELLIACLHAEIFFGNHNNNDITNDSIQSEQSEEKSFPDFPNKGLPLDEGLNHFMTRYCNLLDFHQLRLKLGTCNVEIANTCWDHMIPCMKRCVSSDDNIMMMLSAGNHDSVVKILSNNLKEDNVSPWLPLYISRYAIFVILCQYIRIHQYRMVTSDPSGTVEVCVDHYPHLQIWEVARLYHVIPTHYPTGKRNSSQSNESSYVCYCKYIQQLCEKETVEWACFHDNVYLILLWMESLLRTDVSIATELR